MEVLRQLEGIVPENATTYKRIYFLLKRKQPSPKRAINKVHYLISHDTFYFIDFPFSHKDLSIIISLGKMTSSQDSRDCESLLHGSSTLAILFNFFLSCGR